MGELYSNLAKACFKPIELTMSDDARECPDVALASPPSGQGILVLKAGNRAVIVRASWASRHTLALALAYLPHVGRPDVSDDEHGVFG
jgi:hypothetical protein